MEEPESEEGDQQKRFLNSLRRQFPLRDRRWVKSEREEGVVNRRQIIFCLYVEPSTSDPDTPREKLKEAEQMFLGKE